MTLAEDLLKAQVYRDKLVGFLSNAPLYERFTLNGPLDLADVPGVAALMPDLRMHCSVCEQITNWVQIPEPPGALTISVSKFSVNVPRSLMFQCRNCMPRTALLHIVLLPNKIRKLKDGSAVCPVTKIGQFPPLSRRIPRDVERILDKTEVDLYRKAITSRHLRYGIGALAYLRRIVEDQMNTIIDLLADAADKEGCSEQARTLRELRTQRVFSAKVEAVGRNLPERVKPPGQPNPLGILHELTSEGIHGHNEALCIATFDRCRAAFEFVIQRLKSMQREEDQYRKALATLTNHEQGQHDKQGS